MPSPALAWFQDNRSETRSENPRRGATWMLKGAKEAELRKPPPTTSAFALGCEREMDCTAVDPHCGPFREDEEMPFLPNWIGRDRFRRH